ncbi:MAG TPA: MFS transporter [Candidatus Bathyarchaeia archaeon]|nr:MFS transporter [Candidatus Bathyarchaeia archaeon]
MSNRWAVLALIMAAQTMANVGPLGIPSIAPLIREKLDLSVAQAGSFLSAYYVGPVLMSLPAGWLADRWGVRGAMILGQALIALGLFGAAAASSFPLLIGILVLAGAGYGVLNPTTTKAGMAWFPPRQRATIVGLKQMGLPFGGALGALVMPPLALALGWRSAVAVAAAVVGGLALLTWALYRDLPDPPTAAPARGQTAFWMVMGNRDLWLVGSSTLIFAGVQTVFLAFLVLYLHDIIHIPLVTAAEYLVAAQVSGSIGRVVFGMLSDRLFGGRRRIVLTIAGLGSIACSLGLSATTPGNGPPLLIPLAVSIGFFGVGWNGVQHTLMAELAGPRAAGTAVGLGLAISSLGVTVCPPVFGLVTERLGGFGGAWVALAVGMALGLLLLIPVRERPMLAT